MTKSKSFIFLFIIMAALASCTNSSYKKTASGIMYKISSSGNNPLVKRGQILKFHYTQKLNDSLIMSSFNAIPAYAKVDSSGPVYSPLEVLPLLHKGDSVTILQLADTIMKKMGPMQGSQLKKGDKIYLTLKVLDVLAGDAEAQADQAKEMTTESDRETKALESYIAEKKIDVKKSPKGVFVKINDPGNGDGVDSGKYVSVIYTGKLFPSEKVFESNVGKAPIQFTINSQQVIPGWDEGLKMLRKGGKATLYIPATLAYGQQPGPGGKPFENLIFDVELVDVANTAPAPPAPTAPPAQAMPPQGQVEKK